MFNLDSNIGLAIGKKGLVASFNNTWMVVSYVLSKLAPNFILVFYLYFPYGAGYSRVAINFKMASIIGKEAPKAVNQLKKVFVVGVGMTKVSKWIASYLLFFIKSCHLFCIYEIFMQFCWL